MTPQEENTESQRRAKEEQDKLTEANKAAADATDKARAANIKIESATTAVMGQFQKLLDVQLKYQVAMAKGAKGSAQFNDSVDLMTDTMQMAITGLSLLVPGGFLIKGVVAGLTFLATNAMKSAAALQKAANEQGDSLKKAYDTMSKSGATASDGMTGLFKDVNKMRLNVNQLDAMAGVMASNAKEMSAMGGTVYKARKEYANLVQGMGDYEKGMLNLGMSYDDQAEAAMGYMKLQSNLSQGQQKDYGNLKMGMKKYLEETEALSRVSGMNRKEQEAAQEKYMAQQRFGAKIQELRDEGTVESNRAADLLISGMKKAAAQGEIFGQAYADQTTGMITTDAAIRGNQATQGKQLETINGILEGRIKNEAELNDAHQDTITTAKEFGKSMNKVYQMGGEDMMLPFKELQDVSKAATNNFAEQMKDASAEVKKLINNTADIDTQLSRMNDMIKRQNDTMLAEQQKLNDKFMDTGVAAGGFMENLTKAFQPLMDMIMKMIDVWTPLASGLGDMLVGAVSLVVKFMTGDIIGGLTDFKKGWDSAAKGLEETAGKWWSVFTDIWSTFGKNLLKSVEFVTGPLGDVFKNIGKDVKDGIGKFSDALVDMVKDLWKKLSALIPNIGAVSDAAQNVAGKVKGAATSAGDFLSSVFGGGGAPSTAGGGGGAKSTGGGGGGAASSSSGATAQAAPSADSGDPGAKPPADKEVASAGGNVQEGADVRIGNEIRRGGTVSWRTNNPGNVSYGGLSKKYGAIGAWKKMDGDAQQKSTGIAIMPSLDDGDQLKMGLWRRPMYIGKTIDQGVQQWTGTLGPGSGYAKDLARAAGATMDTVIGQLTDSQLLSMITKQRVWEGFKPGKIVQAAEGGVFDGPKSGYSATLHGNEAVIPLKDGAVPVSMSQEFNMTATNLGELVAIMKNNVGMQDRMLAVLDDIRRSQSTMTDNTGKMVAMAA